MWVLTPLVSASVPPKEGAVANGIHFLTCGTATIGRPNKGSTAGVSDIIIYGDSSVSKSHAELTISPAVNPGEPPSVSITDAGSKFHTWANGQQLQPNAPHALAAGDSIKFGCKSRFRLEQLAQHLYIAHASLDVAAAAAAAGFTHGAWGAATTHCIADEGAALTPALASALLQGLPLVRPAWLAKVCAGRAWRDELPNCAAHAPSHLIAPGPRGSGWRLELSGWSAPPKQLLGAFELLLCPGVDPCLAEVVGLVGGATRAWQPGVPLPACCRPGALLLAVAATGDERAHVRAQLAAVDADTLLAAVVRGERAALDAEVERFQGERDAAVRAAAAAAAAAAAVVVDSDETDAEAIEDGADEEEERDMQPLLPVGLVPRKPASAALGLVGDGAGRTLGGSSSGGRAAARQEALAPSGTAGTTRGSRKRPEAQLAAGELHQEEGGVGGSTAGAAMAASGSGRGKRQRLGAEAAPAAAGGGGAGEAEQPLPQASPTPRPGGRRSKQAAADERAALGALPPSPPPSTSRHSKGGGGAAAAAKAAAAAAKDRGVVDMHLVALQDGICPSQQGQQQRRRQQPAVACAAAPPCAGVVNYKAFRRKDQACAALPPLPAPVLPMAVHQEVVAGPDTDQFLMDEQRRQLRIKAADALFEANVKAKRMGGLARG